MNRLDGIYLNAAQAVKTLPSLSRWWLMFWLKPVHRSAIERQLIKVASAKLPAKGALSLPSPVSDASLPAPQESVMTPETARVIRALQQKLER